jgi:ApaG protein
MTIASTTTKYITVTVNPLYLEDQSCPFTRRFVHSYIVTILNKGTKSVKLVKRSWTIYDAAQGKRMVDGIGVSGHQPIIAPGQAFRYVSSIELLSEFGAMWGEYDIRDSEGFTLKAAIPVFDLIAPCINN